VNASVWLLAFSDLFINLSAGWFGAAFVVFPLISAKKKKIKLLTLIGNIVYGIVALVVAVILRSFI